MMHWSYNGGYIDNNAYIGSNGDNSENNSINNISYIRTNGSSGVICTNGIALNGKVPSTFHTCHCTLKSMRPLAFIGFRG